MKGTIPKGKEDFTIKGSIPRPEYFFALEMKKYLIQKGIEVEGDAKYTDDSFSVDYEKRYTTFLDAWKSPQLKEIVARTNSKSINPYANALLFHCGIKFGCSGSYEASIEAVRDFWLERGVAISGLNPVDGSGLSRENSVSSAAFVQLLCNMSEEVRELLIPGLKSLAGQNEIRVKSGYMQGVRSYTGYIQKKNGELIAFSIIVNDYNCSASAMREKIENLIVSYL